MTSSIWLTWLSFEIATKLVFHDFLFFKIGPSSESVLSYFLVNARSEFDRISPVRPKLSDSAEKPSGDSYGSSSEVVTQTTVKMSLSLFLFKKMSKGFCENHVFAFSKPYSSNWISRMRQLAFDTGSAEVSLKRLWNVFFSFQWSFSIVHRTGLHQYIYSAGKEREREREREIASVESESSSSVSASFKD